MPNRVLPEICFIFLFAAALSGNRIDRTVNLAPLQQVERGSGEELALRAYLRAYALSLEDPILARAELHRYFALESHVHDTILRERARALARRLHFTAFK